MRENVRNIQFKEAAQMLNIGPNILRRKLIEADIFVKGSDGLPALPREEHITEGRFDTVLTKYKVGNVDHWTTKALVTSKGIAFLREFLNDNPDSHPLKNKSSLTSMHLVRSTTP